MKTIPLTQGLYATVDDEDFDRLNQYKWKVVRGHRTFYAIRQLSTNGKYKSIYMHREILGLQDRKVEADHIDHNGLNNTRQNLRPATRSENLQNTSSRPGSSSKYLGVWLDKATNRWAASVKLGKTIVFVGRFTDETAAARARDKVAKKLHGKFANLNFKL